MANPFRPPEDSGELKEQLARLKRGLRHVGAVGQLGKSATPEEIALKLNQVILRRNSITGEGGREVKTSVVIPANNEGGA